jgi:hypothetical protein
MVNGLLSGQIYKTMIFTRDVLGEACTFLQIHWLIIMFHTMVAIVAYGIPAAENPANILQCIPPISMFMRLFMSMLFMILPTGIHFSPFCLRLLVSIL